MEVIGAIAGIAGLGGGNQGQEAIAGVAEGIGGMAVTLGSSIMMQIMNEFNKNIEEAKKDG